MLGKSILGYTVDKEIGSGGFGTVYKVSKSNIAGTEIRALKHISIPSKKQYMDVLNSMGGDQQKADDYFVGVLKNVINEIQIIRSMSSGRTANIVTYYENDIEEHGSPRTYDVYILMEYLKPLTDYESENVLVVSDVVRLAKDMLAALIACHSHNVIHRDIKEDNIFVSQDGVFKLGDFGVSKVLKDRSSAESMKGTPNYIAPEVYLGKEKYDNTVDLYSLGIVLYRMLNGFRGPFMPTYPAPYTSTDEDVAFEKRMKYMTPDLPYFAQNALGEAIIRAIKPKGERYSSAQEFMEEIRQVESILTQDQLDVVVTKGMLEETVQQTQRAGRTEQGKTYYYGFQPNVYRHVQREENMFETINSNTINRNKPAVNEKDSFEKEKFELQQELLTRTANSLSAHVTHNKKDRLGKEKVRKIMICVVIAVLLIFLCVIGYSRMEQDSGKYFTTKMLSDKTLSIVGYDGMETDIVIPMKVGNVVVTEIDESAFSYHNELTSITIPESITTIGKAAFSGCTSLTNITIPRSVTIIGENAFSFCDNLTSITIPGSVTSIGNWGLSLCSNLTSITILDGVEAIADSAFSGCRNLTSITIPESVISIGQKAFEGCEKLTSVTIPGNINVIEEATFSSCSSLKNVTLPESVIAIGKRSFSECSSLTSIMIPGSVNEIGDAAFSFCSSLKSVTLPENVATIGEYSFGECSSLTSITIPASVRAVGDSAFSGCSSLKSIAIMEGVTAIGTRVFEGCNNLISITLPDSVARIGGRAFYNCERLTDITLPNSLTHIGNDAFCACISLTKIKIPDSVTYIGEGAFSGCSGLMSITIPESVSEIKYGTLAGCPNLIAIVKADSYAHRYCEEMGINYVLDSLGNYETLQKGDVGIEVESLQQRLMSYGYYDSTIDGIYGDMTFDAICAFQQCNNITVTGEADNVTQQLLRDNDPKEYVVPPNIEISCSLSSSIIQGDELSIVRTSESSFLKDQYYSYTSKYVLDNNDKHCWAANGERGTDIGEWIALTMSGKRMVEGFAIRNGYQIDERRYYGNYRPKELLMYADGEYVGSVYLKDIMGTQYVKLSEAVLAKTIRFEIASVYDTNKDKDACITSIKLYTFEH